MNEKEKILDNLNEEYYQINPDIMGSFPKYRPPLNLFKFKEDVSRIMPYYKVGDRLSNEQVDEVATLVKDGLLFVSRDDHPVYVKHISFQLDLVLVDKHLKESEIADIFVEALTMRLKEFFDQPVKPVYDRLEQDILVLTEYLWSDQYRIRALLRRLRTEHNLANHSFNTGIVGLALYFQFRASDFKDNLVKRKTFDQVAAALFIHDVGMTKVPAFILDKDKQIMPDERQKILQHPKHGLTTIDKLDLRFQEFIDCVHDHHERINGSGYPQKKAGKDISHLAMICAVADSFSAMISKRRYAEAQPMEAAAKSLTSDKRYDERITQMLHGVVLTMHKKPSPPGAA